MQSRLMPAAARRAYLGQDQVCFCIMARAVMALSSLLGVNDLSGRVAHNAFNLNRVIQLPPLRPGDCHFTTEIMRFTVTGNHIAAFHFAIEVCAGGKMAREAFEWRKLKKGDDDTKGRGFQLVRLGAGSEDASQGLFSSTLSPSLGETVAVLDWPKGLSSLARVFPLQMKGSGQPNILGQRWVFMVL